MRQFVRTRPDNGKSLKKRSLHQGIAGFTLLAFLLIQLAWPLPASAIRQTNVRDNVGLEEGLSANLRAEQPPVPTPVSAAGMEEPMTAEQAVDFLGGPHAGLQVDVSYLTLRVLKPGQRSLHLGSSHSYLPLTEALMGLQAVALDIKEDRYYSMMHGLSEQIKEEISRRGGKFHYLLDDAIDPRNDVLSLEGNYGQTKFDHVVALDLISSAPWPRDQLQKIIETIIERVSPGGTVLISGTYRPDASEYLKRHEPAADGAALLSEVLRTRGVLFDSRRVTDEVPKSTFDTEVWLFIIHPQPLTQAPAAGLEEKTAAVAKPLGGTRNRMQLERMTEAMFHELFPQAKWLERARAVYLQPASEVATKIRFYVAHDTIWPGVERLVYQEWNTLPKGLEVYLLRLPKDAEGLEKSLGAILKDWLLKLPFSQHILPELEISLSDPLPSLPTLVLYALKGAGSQVEAVIGMMNFQDAQGNTLYAYFV